jgi:gliding motility-associated-like protein
LFSPSLNVNGTASVEYVIGDAGGATSNSSTLSITIVPVNDAPVLMPGSIIATQGLAKNGNILLGGSDPDGSALQVNTVPVSGPSHGSITINPDGAYSYTADPSFVGTDEVVIEVCDSGLPLPGICVNVSLSVEVVQNQAPSVTTKRSSLNEDFSFDGNVLNAGDNDPEGLPLKVNTLPIDGPLYGSITIRTNGTYTYTPSVNFNGVDTVKVEVCDTNPIPACSIVPLIFTVMPVNDAPVLIPDAVPGDRNKFAAGNILTGDADPDSTQLIVNTTPVSGPLHGTIVIDQDGNYTYTPDLNFVGTDEVTFEVCDSGSPSPGICVTSTLTIAITDPHAGVIFVPEGFSPNDDGTNDRFEILYTGTEPIYLEIFNRWGNIVYKSDNYQNDWNGVSMFGITIGDELPDGTYFYKVTIGQFRQTKSFTLQR